MPKPRILVIDDESAIRDSLRMTLEYAGFEFVGAATGQEGLALAERESPDLVLLDIKMPGMDGMELQERLAAADPELTVIIMTGYASVETAVRALKQGAYDYITKPVDPDELSHLVSKALEHRRTKEENVRLRENLRDIFPRTELVGNSPAIKRVVEFIQTVASTDATVFQVMDNRMAFPQWATATADSGSAFGVESFPDADRTIGT